MVLGSGLLLDVPLEQLSQRFKKVMLVDVVQLRSVRHRCQKLANVTLLEHDVTGLAESLLAYHSAHPTNSGSGPLGELSNHYQLHATVQGFYNWSPTTD